MDCSWKRLLHHKRREHSTHTPRVYASMRRGECFTITFYGSVWLSVELLFSGMVLLFCPLSSGVVLLSSPPLVLLFVSLFVSSLVLFVVLSVVLFVVELSAVLSFVLFVVLLLLVSLVVLLFVVSLVLFDVEFDASFWSSSPPLPPSVLLFEGDTIEPLPVPVLF